jgi:predicted transcriptional regulator of viral defense system
LLANTERLLEAGFNDHVFKDWDLATIFPGTAAKRYAILHKAVEKGEILRLHRGVYMLSPKYREKNVSTFSVASRIISGSFISFETALSFHGWIPEKVTVIKSVIATGRTRAFATPLGEFEYIKIPVNEYEFLSGVSRKEIDNQSFLIAKPLRAIADYVYTRKIEGEVLSFLHESMRIDKENLESLTSKDFDEVFSVYTSKRVLLFLQNFRRALEK